MSTSPGVDASSRPTAVPVVAGAVALATTGTLPIFMLTAQAVLVTEDLGLTASQLGILVTVFFSVSALSSVPTGRLTERVGARTAARTTGVMSAVSLLAVALVPTASLWVLGGLLALAALANSLSQAAANLMLARGISLTRQGSAFGIKQSSIPLATAIGGMAVPTVGTTLGWRAAFIGAAALAAVITVVVPHVCRHLAPPAARAASATRTRLVSVRPLVLLGIATALGSAAMGSLMAYLALWATGSGMGVSSVGLLMSLAGIGSIVVRILSGFIADRRRGGNNIAIVIGHVLLGVVGVGLVATGETPLIIAGAVLTISFSWAWPGLLLFTVVRTNPDAPASATGIIQMGAYGGNAAGPGLFGLVLSVASFEAAWLAGAVALLGSAALMTVARQVRLAERRRLATMPA